MRRSARLILPKHVLKTFSNHQASVCWKEMWPFHCCHHHHCRLQLFLVLLHHLLSPFSFAQDTATNIVATDVLLESSLPFSLHASSSPSSLPLICDCPFPCQNCCCHHRIICLQIVAASHDITAVVSPLTDVIASSSPAPSSPATIIVASSSMVPSCPCYHHRRPRRRHSHHGRRSCGFLF